MSSHLEFVLKLSSVINLVRHLWFLAKDSTGPMFRAVGPAKGPSSTQPIAPEPSAPKAFKMGDANRDPLDAGLSRVQSQ